MNNYNFICEIFIGFLPFLMNFIKNSIFLSCEIGAVVKLTGVKLFCRAQLYALIQAASWIFLSLIIPFLNLIFSPDSNCGLISAINSLFSLKRLAITGIAWVIDIKLKSATIRSICSEKSFNVKFLTFLIIGITFSLLTKLFCKNV